MKYRIYKVSEDGLLKRPMDKWDDYDYLFKDYDDIDTCRSKIEEMALEGRINGSLKAEFVILPVASVKLGY